MWLIILLTVSKRDFVFKFIKEVVFVGVFEQFPYTNFHDLNLDWILQEVKKALEVLGEGSEKIDALTTRVTEAENEIQALKIISESIKDELKSIENGDYVHLYLNSISNWIDSNLQQMVAKIVKFVAFEIDDSGCFIAIIPDTWDFLEFDTITDTTNENYGHLVLEW